MRFALLFGVFLTLFFLVESSMQDEFIEDEDDEENESRHHLRKVRFAFISQNLQLHFKVVMFQKEKSIVQDFSVREIIKIWGTWLIFLKVHH